MGRVRDLLTATRRSRRRIMKLRSPRTGDMMLYAWLMVAIFARFTLNCAIAARELSKGSRWAGLAITEFSMLHFLLIAFLLSFLSSLMPLSAAGLDGRRLALAAVPVRALLAADLDGLWLNPLSWVVLLFALPAAVPLLALPSPGASVASLLAGCGSAILAGAGVGRALSLNGVVRKVSGAIRFIFAGAMFVLVFANFDFQWSGETIRVILFNKGTLLLDAAGAGVLSAFRPWSMSIWILQGWIAPCAGVLAGCLLLYLAACAKSAAYGGRASHRALAEPPVETRARGMRPRRPAEPAELAAPAAAQGTRHIIFRSELRRLVASPASVTGYAVSLGCLAWQLAGREPTIGIPILGGFLVLLTGFSYISNIFGRDGQALRRYALLSVDWSAVFAAKDLAWLAVTGGTVAPLVLAAALRSQARDTLSFTLAACMVVVLTVVWGNLGSILFPADRSRARAATRAAAQTAAQGPAFANQVAPFVLCGLPLAIHRTVAPFGSLAFDAVAVLCSAAGLALWYAFLRRVVRAFDVELESVLDRF